MTATPGFEPSSVETRILVALAGSPGGWLAPPSAGCFPEAHESDVGRLAVEFVELADHQRPALDHPETHE
jgi:hypothetical protein